MNYLDFTDEQLKRIEEDLGAFINTEVWQYLKAYIEYCLDIADTIEDVPDMDSFWFRKGQIDAYRRLIGFIDPPEQPHDL